MWVVGDTEVYDITGDLIDNQPDLYGDQNWQLSDAATDEVNMTEGGADCAAVANPVVVTKNKRPCVECRLADADDGISQAILIPTASIRVPILY